MNVSSILPIAKDAVSPYTQAAIEKEEDSKSDRGVLASAISLEVDKKRLEANPNTFTSVFDNASTISNDTHTVTLVRDKGGNHARLVVEGVKNQEKFIYVAHFTGGRSGYAIGKKKIGVVKSNWITGEKLKKFSIYQYASRSLVWSVSASKVQAMIDSIEREKNNPDSNPIAFSLFGSSSLMIEDMAYYKLKEVNVKNESEQKEIQELKKLQEDNPEKFDHLTSLLREQQLDQMARFSYLHAFATPRSCLSLLFRAFPGVEDSIVALRTLHRERQIHANERLLNLLKKHTTTIVVKRNSCFTWARGKVNMLDGKLLPRKPLDSIISVTKFYTPHEIARAHEVTKLYTEIHLPMF